MVLIKESKRKTIFTRRKHVLKENTDGVPFQSGGGGRVRGVSVSQDTDSIKDRLLSFTPEILKQRLLYC